MHIQERDNLKKRVVFLKKIEAEHYALGNEKQAVENL